MRNNIKFYLLSLLIIICFILVLNKIRFNTSIDKESQSGLKIINYSKELGDKNLYDSIKCRKSAQIIVSTIICVHDLTKDAHVSRAIWQEGIWEGPIMRTFVDYLEKNPDWLVFDVGAQVGQFSLFAAKMGRDVISVEPFYDNILRIHKAIRAEFLQKRITLINNALSNKREVKRLFPYANDLGGQTLLKHKNEIYSRKDMLKDKYLVETILFDDIIDIIPKRPDGKDYEKAILKIDIEGFEPYAFDEAKKLFDKIDFQVIFMEWVHLPRHPDMANLVEKMIKLMTNHQLEAFDNDRKLDPTNWRQWPQDVLWLKIKR